MTTPAAAPPALQAFIERHQRIFVLTGAGCSTRSGIPDYRDVDGQWKRAQPVTYQAFMGESSTRQRYWARSLVGWPRFVTAQPNGVHHALAALEARGQLSLLLTQNVDRLHQAAGSLAVVDLHGRLDVVRCMGCERRTPRAEFQSDLIARNPGWDTLDAGIAPDGDADLENVDFAAFSIPACRHCGGILKPDVVYFGENVPRERVHAAQQALADSDAMLVVGSSLMVYSGFRFAQWAHAAGTPIAALTLGRTRADDLLTLKVQHDCAEALGFLRNGAAGSLSA
ncbi:MAG: NAD-dependent protein deacetylase [Pseudoxanthomonas sp.]